MRVEPTSLKIAGALGTLAVASAATVTVVADQRPGGAPLKPPVSGTAPAAQLQSGAAPALSIPETPVCEPAGAGNLGTAAGTGRSTTSKTGSASSATDPAVAAALQQVVAAPQATRRQVLQQAMQPLTADQRQQLTALIQQTQRRAQPARGAGTLGGCRGTGGDTTGMATDGGGGTISPSVTALSSSSSTPLVVSAVS